MLSVKKADMADFDRIMDIYKYAQDYMIKSGNPTQWGHFYPDEELIKFDISRKVCRVIYDQDGIHRVFAVFNEAEPTYEHIENGEWLNYEPYLTIHRLAGDGRVHGLFGCALDYCKEFSGNIRVDTHADNLTMQKLIEKSGFTRCGIIHVKNGSARIAYHWSK